VNDVNKATIVDPDNHACRGCARLYFAGYWHWRALRLAAQGRSADAYRLGSAPGVEMRDRATWTGEHCDCGAGLIPPVDLDAVHICACFRPAAPPAAAGGD